MLKAEYSSPIHVHKHQLYLLVHQSLKD